MADISGVISSGGGLVDYLTDKNNTSYFDTSYTATSSNKLLSDAFKAQSGQSAYGTGLSSAVGQAALKRALAEMGVEGGKVTFADIAEYQAKLEAEFSESFRKAVEELGVSPDTRFTLNISSEGNISVDCADAVAKAKIEKYLEDTPKAREQFSYIQALANLDRAKQSSAASSPAWRDMGSVKKAIQAEAVQLFFSDALSSGMNFTSMLASFSPESENASYFTGLSYIV